MKIYGDYNSVIKHVIPFLKAMTLTSAYTLQRYRNGNMSLDEINGFVAINLLADYTPITAGVGCQSIYRHSGVPVHI